MPNLDGQTPRMFDAIVIGSGYGGSVSAYRLAQAGLSVAVLEAGYPHKAPIVRGQGSQWLPEQGRFGPHTVTKLSPSVKAWHGTAVGGGSIVNAAVMIRKDDFENWPGGITRASLDPYYDRAEQLLEAQPYPLHQAGSPYGATRKSHYMLRAADRLGVQSVMAPVAVTYREKGEPVGTIKINSHGAEQQGCRQCGQCSLPGCDFQAKNSLDFNYLFSAEHKYGAKIVPGSKVDKIEPFEAVNGGGYRLTVVEPKTGAVSIYEAKVVVVSAGCIGSSELLLRNKVLHRSLPGLSPALGRQYTTNGTFIGFAIRSKETLDPAGGPEITAGLNFPGPDGKSQGHLVFDGSFNGFSYNNFFITGRLVGLPNWLIKVVTGGFKIAEKLKLVRTQTTLPLLVIGRDKAVGRFSLDEGGRLKTDLNPKDNASFYARANQHMRAFTRAMGASFLPFPLWSLRGKIDVPHNLGGVPMGSDASRGVVDDMGRVYGYDNLLVLDGSIVPSSMGANPALTIAALAERSMESVLAQYKAEGVIRTRQEKVEPPPPVRDLTALFKEMHSQVASGAYEARERFSIAGNGKGRARSVLWVPGLLARHKGNHSVHVLRRMRKLGLDVVAVPVNSDVATAENIVLITRLIDEIVGDGAILAGHSRGGIMLLDAYRALPPEKKAKIERIILIQSPVNGTPLADLAIGSGFRRRAVAAISRVFLGNNINDTLVELSTEGRAHADRMLPPLTPEDRAKIYTLRSKISRGQSPSLDVPRAIIGHYGYESDGITPYAPSEIAGAGDVTLTAYDHENCVIQEPTLAKRLTLYRPNKIYEAGDVIESLLRLALSGK